VSVGVTLLEILEPHVAAGDPIALEAAARLTAATNIDAEAQAVIDEWAAAIRGYAELIRRIIGESLEDPDRCWRCDAKPGEGPLGLCPACHTDLATGE
jgi:hypothetical protein